MSKPKLSLLICSLSTRSEFLDRLLKNLYTQKESLQNPDDLEICILMDNGEMTIGEKRNKLKNNCNGDYFAFIDDDDDVSPDYVKLNMEGIVKGVDCNSLIGNFYDNGKFVKPFIHSNKYNSWYEDDKYYYRCPNHLNTFRKEAVAGVDYEHINFGEDGRWSMAVKNKGLIKTEHEILTPIYYYYFRSK